MLNFSIQRLHAWSPDINCKWNESEDFKLFKDPKYNNLLVPTNQARRMSKLSKFTVDLALSCSNTYPLDYAVFSTRYGELESTVSLFESIRTKEDLSPTKFSQSVHNTAAGLYSIIAKNPVPIQCISSGASSFLSGLISAVSYLTQHSDAKVLFVHSDDQVPDPLYAFADSFDRDSIGLALLLSTTEGKAFSLKRNATHEKPIKQYSQAKYFLENFFLSQDIILNSENSTWSLCAE